jgi:hypothetical protein
VNKLTFEKQETAQTVSVLKSSWSATPQEVALDTETPSIKMENVVLYQENGSTTNLEDNAENGGTSVWINVLAIGSDKTITAGSDNCSPSIEPEKPLYIDVLSKCTHLQEFNMVKEKVAHCKLQTLSSTCSTSCEWKNFVCFNSQKWYQVINVPAGSTTWSYV